MSGSFLQRVPVVSLTERLPLNSYRAIMSFPTFGYVCQAVNRTRNYDAGLDASMLLLRLSEDYKKELTAHEYEQNLLFLYKFFLEMLDRLDRWEEYLDCWKQIRNNTTIVGTYHLDQESRRFHGDAIKPFIVEDRGTVTKVHFLYGTHHRKEIIERKLERKWAGKSVKHLMHHPQSELTDEEIDERLKWVCRMAHESQRR